jgi:hypothetical protein
MARIAIGVEAFEAIARTMPLRDDNVVPMKRRAHAGVIMANFGG